MKKIIVACLLSFCFCLIVQNSLAGQVPDRLTGTWQGTVSLYLPIASMQHPSPVPEDNPVLSIRIHEDGSVIGNLGPAILKNCRVKRNRGWLFRKLNFKTDFIITGGTLEGCLTKQDHDPVKKFTIPFNIKEGRMVGSVMWTHRFKYPDPVARVKLIKIQED